MAKIFECVNIFQMNSFEMCLMIVFSINFSHYYTPGELVLKPTFKNCKKSFDHK